MCDRIDGPGGDSPESKDLYGHALPWYLGGGEANVQKGHYFTYTGGWTCSSCSLFICDTCAKFELSAFDKILHVPVGNFELVHEAATGGNVGPPRLA